MTQPPRSWHLNRRAAVILALVVLVLLGAVAGGLLYQASTGRGRAQLRMAERLSEAGPENVDLALSYLDEALQRDPELLPALELKADLLARSRDTAPALDEAFLLGSRALRLEPEGPTAQATRRRQIELALRLIPMVSRDASRLGAATPLAQEYLERVLRDHGGVAPSDPKGIEALIARLQRRRDPGAEADRAALAEAYRLLARVKQAAGDPANLNAAVADYERVRRLAPGDLTAATALAALYQGPLARPDQARRVLDDLLRAGETAQVRLLRHSFHAEHGQDLLDRGRDAEADAAFARAEAELKRAEALAPDDPEVHYRAAGYYLNRGQPAAAQAALARLPKAERAGYRAQTIAGLIELAEHRPDDAVAAWRSGLLLTHGTNAALTWQLADVLLQLGRLDEAAPLIQQFGRLIGDPNAPQARFLGALAQKQRNLPAEAIKALEDLRHRAGPLTPRVDYLLGQCYEAIRDEARAAVAYRRVLEADPRFAAARAALVRLLLASHSEQAELLARQDPNDPALLVTRARLELRRQQARPADRRDFRGAEGLLRHAADRAPADVRVRLAQADLLDATGRAEEALGQLETACRDRRLQGEPAVWLARAARLSRRGRPDEAARVLEQAAAPDNAGDHVSIRKARAKLLTLQGRSEEARRMLVDGLDNLPPDQRPEAWQALGDLYTAARRDEEARRAYTQWAELRPQDPFPRFFLFGRARFAGDTKAAEAQLKALRDLSGEQGPYYRAALAVRLLDDPTADESKAALAGRLEQAEALIARLEAEQPQLPIGPMLRGRLLELRKQPDEAAKAYELALARGATAAVLPRLVRIYADQDRPADLDRLRREHGVDLPGLDRLAAEAALQRGSKDEAEALAGRIVAADPEDLNLRIWHSRFLNTLGKPAAAEATLRELVERRPADAAPWLALLTFQAGRRATAGATADTRAPTAEQIRATIAEMEAKARTDQPEFLRARAWQRADEPARAAEAFEQAVAKWPADPAVVRGAAEFYRNIGRPADADRILEAARRRDPKARWATRDLAILRAEQADGRPEAWKAASRLLAEAPAEVAQRPEERLARAAVLARGPSASEHREAATILRGLIADLPADLPDAITARGLLAQIELKDGHPERAADALAAEARAPDARPAALRRYIEALIAAKRFDDAEKALARLEKVDAPPGRAAGATAATVVLYRAALLQGRGQEAEAVALLERDITARLKAAGAAGASAADGQEAELAARAACDLLVSWKQAEAALRIAEALIAVRPQASWVKAVLLTQQGHSAEALEGLRAAAETVAPANLPMVVRRALTAVLGDGHKAPEPALVEAAMAVAEAARRRAPNQPDLIALQGYLLHLQGRHDEALRAFQAALESSGDDPQLLNNLAWTLAVSLDQPAEGLKRIDEAIRRGGTSPTYLDTRGVIYTRLGKFAEAIRDLEEAAQARTSATYLAHLALAYRRAGRLEDFRKARDQALKAGLTPEQLDPAERDASRALFEDRAGPDRGSGES